MRGGLRAMIEIDRLIHDVGPCRLDVRVVDGPLCRVGNMVRPLFDGVFRPLELIADIAARSICNSPVQMRCFARRQSDQRRRGVHGKGRHARPLRRRGHALVHVLYRMAHRARGIAGIVQTACCTLHMPVMFDGLAQRRVPVQRQVFVHLPLDIRWQVGLARVRAHLAQRLGQFGTFVRHIPGEMLEGRLVVGVTLRRFAEMLRGQDVVRTLAAEVLGTAVVAQSHCQQHIRGRCANGRIQIAASAQTLHIVMTGQRHHAADMRTGRRSPHRRPCGNW